MSLRYIDRRMNFAWVLGSPFSECRRKSCQVREALRVAPDYADAMFNLALLLQRKNQYAEGADHWRRYLISDGQSEWAARACRSLKFCEMQFGSQRAGKSQFARDCVVGLGGLELLTKRLLPRHE
jgi:hypothetical protein